MPHARTAPIEMSKDEFTTIGYQLVDRIADFLHTIREKPVTTDETQLQLQQMLAGNTLPEDGLPPEQIVATASDLLLDYSLLNGHPKFMGYITSSASPIGALADMLAAAVNPNVGANILSPMATEIERQTIQWLAEMIGVPDYGGLLVSGGNMANFTAFLAARTVKAPKQIKEDGIANAQQKLTVYCCKTTHTWIEKAVVLFGLGTKAIRWIPALAANVMDNKALEDTIKDDLAHGCQPLMVIAAAGDVSTGAVDDLAGIADICRRYNLWFHVDGAYGAPATILPELAALFAGLQQADSIALDPHKWLYCPLEAGCTLVKNPNHLLETYSAHPVYYNFDGGQGATHNYYEYGLQNSRGGRALKVWMTLQQAGRSGYTEMIREDIRLARLLFDLAAKHPEFEAVTHNLSITTFRYNPLRYFANGGTGEDYLNKLNEALLNTLQRQGRVFLSNAVVDGKYCLRACIVNFRTSQGDIEEIPEIIAAAGRKMHAELNGL